MLLRLKAFVAFLKSQSRKRLIIMAGLLVLGMGVTYWLYNKLFSSSFAVPPTAVVVAQVTAQEMPITIEAFGHLRAFDSAEMTSQRDGIIKDIQFKGGELVQAQTPLIQLEDATERAELIHAQTAYEHSESEYERRKQLVGKGAVSQQEVEQTEVELQNKQAALEIAQDNLNSMLIKAPFAGRLGERRVSVGQYVAVGDPLVTIVDKTRLRLQYSISEKYLSKVAKGQTVSLQTNAYPGRLFEGTVDFISPYVDPNTRLIAVEAVIENHDETLSPGLSVQLAHAFSSMPSALAIPEESLIPTISGYEVYKIEKNHATLAPVKIGTRRQGQVHVIEGLSENEVVVVRGQQKLREGAPVQIVEDKG